MKSRLSILVGSLLGLAAIGTARSSAAMLPDLNIKGWTWFEDDTNYPMTCMSTMQGQTNTGYGVYVPSTWHGNIAFVLDGGGFCYDSMSCANVDKPANIAAVLTDVLLGAKPGSNLVPFVARDHYTKGDFDNDTTDSSNMDANGVTHSTGPLNRGVFEHGAAGNPFNDYLMIFIPYCSGDLHIGYQTDTTSHIAARAGGVVPARMASGKNHYGLLDSYYTFATVLQAVSNFGKTPAKVVMMGGSAGGFGSMFLYGWLRYLLGLYFSHAQVITISDGGTPLWSGQSSNGTSWSSQGYLQLPGVSTSIPTSMEEWWYDAWGLSTLASIYPAGLVTQPLGDGHSFLPIQNLEYYNFVNAASNPSFNGYGDKFGIVDSTSDWLYAAFTPAFMTDDAFGRHPNILDVETEVVNTFTSNVFFKVTSTATPSGSTFPFWKHHTFIGDEVATWAPTGSDLTRVLWNHFTFN